MQTYYTKWYSPSVGREMEIKVYGHAGRPVLFIPCQDGRFFDFENYRMTDAWAPWIESGQCMVFSIDTLDKETYSATYDPHDRIRRHDFPDCFLSDGTGHRAGGRSERHLPERPGSNRGSIFRSGLLHRQCARREGRVHSVFGSGKKDHKGN